MSVAVMSLLIAAVPVPAIVAGPDLEQQAKEVEAPISEVTVFSDRARIQRRTQVTLTPGVSRLRLPDLPGAAMLDTVRVAATGARVLRVEAVPIERGRASIIQVADLLDKLDEHDDKLAHLEGKKAAEQAELSFLNTLLPAPALTEAQRDGRPPLTLDPASWFASLDLLRQRADAARTSIRALDEALRKENRAAQQVRKEIGKRNQGGFSSRVVRVLVIVSAPRAAKSEVELEYFMKGASWKPVYDLQLLAQHNRLVVKTAAMVQQATGEDWGGVELNLSTAIPGRGIDFPELLTWTLGEKREFIPRPRPRRRPPKPPVFAAPKAKPKPWERERRVAMGLLQERLRKRAIAQAQQRRKQNRGRSGEKSQRTYDFADDDIDGQMVQPEGKKAAPPRRPPPSPSVRLSASADVAEEQSVSVLSSVGGALGSFFGGGGSSGPSYRRTPMDLFDKRQRRGPRFSDPALPAVAAGGFDYVYPAATRVSVPSDGDKRRVPLTVDSYPVQTFYEATPALSKTAYLKATVTNRGERPLLRGPANIFLGSEYAGQANLQTTGPGGEIAFPLGADEDIRFVRKVIPKTETKGVFSKDDITTYRTEIEIGNYKKRPVRLSVVDLIPKTNNEDIEIEFISASPRPTEPPDKQGLMRWIVAIKPGETKKLVFTYSIKRPTNWQLNQR